MFPVSFVLGDYLLVRSGLESIASLLEKRWAANTENMVGSVYRPKRFGLTAENKRPSVEAGSAARNRAANTLTQPAKMRGSDIFSWWSVSVITKSI